MDAKRKWKRWVSALLTVAMLISLAACGATAPKNETENFSENSPAIEEQTEDTASNNAVAGEQADTVSVDVVWEKGYVENKGIPLYVDVERDLTAKPNANPDSWYVISNFECDGKQLGFMWHQQIGPDGTGGWIQTIEFLQMDADENVWNNNSFVEPVSETSGADSDKLRVYSSIGELSGDYTRMTLKLTVDDGALDVTLTPKKDILYNGTTGLLFFLGGINSYEYAYPNMDIEGTFTLKGTEYSIQGATAWFDRQWGDEYDPNANSGTQASSQMGAWLWLGMPLNAEKGSSISLWDSYSGDGRYAFATVLHEDGTQINVRADVTYKRIWESKNTGNKYPYDVHIVIPEEELELTLSSVIDEPEFYREGSPITGCQSFCKVAGVYKGETIDRYAILEMVGDLGNNI